MDVTVRDIGLLGLRLGVGLSVAAHGAQKLFGWFDGGGPAQTAEVMSTVGFEPAERHAMVAGVVEAGGGVLVALGLATGPAAGAVSGNMVVAGSVHAGNGFFNTSGGFELPATYAWVMTMLGLTGPGALSVDALLGETLNKPWMRWLAFGAAGVSAAYLVRQSQRELAQRESHTSG